jgi:hypothetical protein
MAAISLVISFLLFIFNIVLRKAEGKGYWIKNKKVRDLAGGLLILIQLYYLYQLIKPR